MEDKQSPQTPGKPDIDDLIFHEEDHPGPSQR